MKTILITGLDGSGKSTVFEKLKLYATTQTGFLHVPTFQTACFPPGFAYAELCLKINEMGLRADELQLPLLKIYALFGSMTLFSKIETAFRSSGKELVIAERHPLIDTSMYAQVYRSYMNPDTFSEGIFSRMDAHFGSSLKHILELTGYHDLSPDSPAKSLLQFIYTEFGNEPATLSHLSALFHCRLPDQTYFLDAPAPVLMDRIGNRTVKEHHEAEEKLDFLRNAYLKALKDIPHVTIVPAADFEALNQFVETMKTNLSF